MKTSRGELALIDGIKDSVSATFAAFGPLPAFVAVAVLAEILVDVAVSCQISRSEFLGIMGDIHDNCTRGHLKKKEKAS